MPHYVILFNFTDQGKGNIKDTIKRAADYRTAVESAGGRLIGEYYTIGKHDIVTIVEAPSDQAMMLVLLATGKLGNVRSETLKAFPISEAVKVIEKLP